jgi:hypothetical protein
MTSLVIKVKWKQCKHVNTVSQLGLIVAEDRCVLEAGHKGFHRGDKGVWATHDRLQSFVENDGRSL